MSTPRPDVGGVYEIETVCDFLKVPIERRHICLKEFAVWLTIAEASAITNQEFGADVVRLVKIFKWLDDDKGEVNIVWRVEMPPEKQP